MGPQTGSNDLSANSVHAIKLKIVMQSKYCVQEGLTQFSMSFSLRDVFLTENWHAINWSLEISSAGVACFVTLVPERLRCPRVLQFVRAFCLCTDVKLTDTGSVLVSPEQCVFGYGSIDLLAGDDEDDVFSPWVWSRLQTCTSVHW